MITIICPCGKKIFTSLCRAKRKKYCSKKCFYQYKQRPSGLKYKIKVINKGWFKKGRKPWHIGTKGIMKINSGSIKKGEHKGIDTEFKKGKHIGKKNNNWKGNNVGYFGLHTWINKTYGKAKECKNRKRNILKFKCSGKSKNYDWALLKGKKYERKIKNFIMLCHSCHLKYDYDKAKYKIVKK